MTAFGAIWYFDSDLRDRPENAISILMAFQEFILNGRLLVQGMYAGTDKWSRRKTIGTTALKELQADVAGGVFDEIVVSRGTRTELNALMSLSTRLVPTRCVYPGELSIVSRLTDTEDLQRAEKLTHVVWNALDASYGISVLGQSLRDVQSDLSTIPIHVRDASEEPERERALVSLQRQRAQFGKYIRPAAWGNFLGANLAGQLGGGDEVVRTAPVGHAELLQNGGVYLRLSATAVLPESTPDQASADTLTRFLEPILLPRIERE